MPLFREVGAQTLTTLHGRQDLADLLPLYRAFPDMPLVSVSNAQRQLISEANFAKTIYHGLPLDLRAPTYEAGGGYLAFLGRISPEKRPDRAIVIANALGLPLRIAAKVDKVDQVYFREVVTPLLGRAGVESSERSTSQQSKIPRRRTGVALSNRLARTIWTRHD